VKPGFNGYNESKLPGLANLPAAISWLVSRQVEYVAEFVAVKKLDEEVEAEHGAEEDGKSEGTRQKQPDGDNESTEPLSLEGLSLHESPFVGFNGRCNKRVDTCYAFWVTGSLDACIRFLSCRSSLIENRF
jgi:geranylgeranyl transferase type-1 subunit beta